MGRVLCLVVALALAACYEVGDVREPAASGGAGGGGNSAGGGNTAGLDAGPPDSGTGSGTAQDASPPDAPNEVGTPDASVVPWASCKDLGYAGECFGTTTVLYYSTTNDCGDPNYDKCIINQCTRKGGQCAVQSCALGWGCSIQLDATQAESCVGLGAEGKCIGNLAIRQEGTTTNCLYKNCAALGLTCVHDAPSPADCF